MGGWLKVSKVVLDDQRVTASVRSVYLTMRRFASMNREERCWASAERIARHAQVTERTVRSGIATLLRLGYVEHLRESLGRHSNLYRVPAEP